MESSRQQSLQTLPTLPNRCRPEVLSFLKNVEGLSQLASQFNFRVTPYGQSGLDKFLSMNDEHQDRVIHGFTSYFEFLSSAVEEGIDLREDGRLLEMFARRMGLVFSNQIYETLVSGDVIEVYTAELIQVYRNLEFMNLCSYTLLDLLSNEFYELYSRSETVNKALLEVGTKLYSREFGLNPISLREIPRHLVKEKFSANKLAIFVDFKEMYPLYTWPNKFYGYLLVQRAEESKTQNIDVSFL